MIPNPITYILVDSKHCSSHALEQLPYPLNVSTDDLKLEEKGEIHVGHHTVTMIEGLETRINSGEIDNYDGISFAAITSFDSA